MLCSHQLIDVKGANKKAFERSCAGVFVIVVVQGLGCACVLYMGGSMERRGSGLQAVGSQRMHRMRFRV